MTPTEEARFIALWRRTAMFNDLTHEMAQLFGIEAQPPPKGTSP